MCRAAFLQRLGNLAVHDGLRQTLDDGSLADAGLADQHRVVLGAAAEHLHDALDFLLAADDRIELALRGGGGQIAAELIEHQRRGGAARLATTATRTGLGRLLALVPAEQLDDLLADPRQFCAELDENLGGDALALTNQAEQNVLGADVVVAELQRLAQAQLQHLLRPRVNGMCPDGACWPWPMISLNLRTDTSRRDAERLERLGCYAFTPRE